MDQSLEALERLAEKAKADRAKKPNARMANEVLAEDNSLRPFSARLTAKEIVRLKALAREEALNPSDLLRRLLGEGMDRLEAKKRNRVDPEQASLVVGQIIDLLDRSGVAEPLLHRGTGT